ncbi:aminodeoxychorismate synthase component I [Paenibacillus xylanexedens]|uniref:aminodeoxychorismate synthase component I n=1 Tax=Paenibacillus xylanexedens TaxID=528191 RepID=UPI0011A6B643|nr:aminodeoxychorismate synthase component I [Paenibacillus xylanexedens]
MDQVYLEEVDNPYDALDTYKLFCEERYSFLLDSSKQDDRLGRYSFIGANPFLVIQSESSLVEIKDENGVSIREGNPFDELKRALKSYHIEHRTGLPFVGGAVGFLSYDLCHQIEDLPKTAVDELHLPEMMMGFYDGIIVMDHHAEKCYAVSAGLPEGDMDTARKRVKELKERIINGIVTDTSTWDDAYLGNEVQLEANFTPEEYDQAICKIKDYIRKGDIYQVNMTQCFTAPLNRHPLNLYDTLRKINPAPFAAYLDLEEFQLVSNSPERFLQLREGIVETRPIKGTMPRGDTPEEDELNRKNLTESVKDQAENLMIVDLMRNDLGRVCEFGSVEVPELFAIEAYSNVFHMVSTVTGNLLDGKDAVDCLTATFPGGSITGAPKVRAMEIIDELEPSRRHVYTGSIGYIGFDGDMDMNIVIRTILVKGQQARYQVGGGIVWDSIPENEYQETLFKGRALQKALLER